MKLLMEEELNLVDSRFLEDAWPLAQMAIKQARLVPKLVEALKNTKELLRGLRVLTESDEDELQLAREELRNGLKLVEEA